jgi:hypothetical protein
MIISFSFSILFVINDIITTLKRIRYISFRGRVPKERINSMLYIYIYVLFIKLKEIHINAFHPHLVKWWFTPLSFINFFHLEVAANWS